MSNLKNPKIPAIIVSVIAIIMIASSYLDFELLNVTAGYIKSWNSMLFSFTLLAGSVNLLQGSSKKILRRSAMLDVLWVSNKLQIFVFKFDCGYCRCDRNVEKCHFRPDFYQL